jgi:prephenate dehydrogenase
LTSEVAPDLLSQVSIVGLGLIGGSLARALRERLPKLRLIGIDRDEVTASADARALVERCISERDASSVAEAFATSDLVLLATPVHAIQRWLQPALAHGAVVTDCGSTKRTIAAAARGLIGASRFVPGHPMAGAGAGRAAASGDLFEGRPWVLCPDATTEPSACDLVEQLVVMLGARPIRMSVEAHDRAVALVSHSPRLAASVLTALAARESALAAAGPAFERLLRGAGGDARIWRDVLESNADEVARALRAVIRELDECAAELEAGGGVERCLDVLAEADGVRLDLEAQAEIGRGA